MGASERGGNRSSTSGVATDEYEVLLNRDRQLRHELAIEYTQLRGRVNQLLQEWDKIDQRMAEIERELPDSYTYPGDPLLDSP